MTANVPSSPRTSKDLISTARACPLERVVLTGFMGSGKSTLGAALAAHLRWEFRDLDQHVELVAGMPVPRIFAERGEGEFRQLETSELSRLLAQKKLVLALGGGAAESAMNQEILRSVPRTVIFHLTAPFEELVRRCRNQTNATERPVLADLDRAKERFMQRQQAYRTVATYTVETSEKTEAEVLGALLALTPVEADLPEDERDCNPPA